MRPVEADHIREALLAAGAEAASPLLNLGSQTLDYRVRRKPHIEARLFEPLRAAGFEIVHADLQSGEGIDEVGDILDPAVVDRLRARGCRAILNNNLLEHVVDPAAVCASCEAIVGPGGLIAVTVPRSYPYHADPIDTGFRPSPAELARLFTRSRLLRGEELQVGGAFPELRSAKGALLFPVRFAWRVANGVRRPDVLRAELARLRWTGRQLSVTLALFEVG